jgi:hypothetical protein
MQRRSPAVSDEIPHPIGIAHPFGGSARPERVGPDDHGDRLTMTRDGDFLASEDALQDARERRSGFADRHRVRHAADGTSLYGHVQWARTHPT